MTEIRSVLTVLAYFEIKTLHGLQFDWKNFYNALDLYYILIHGAKHALSTRHIK